MKPLVDIIQDDLMTVWISSDADWKSIATVFSVITLMVFVLVLLLPNTPLEFW